MVKDNLCPMCGVMAETSGHIIWECESSKAVWMECNRKIQKLSIIAEDGLVWFAMLMDKLDEEELCLVSVLARRIWLHRNSVVFGGQLSSPTFLVHSAETSLAEFNQAQIDRRVTLPSQPLRIRWKKPPTGVIKVNWDAALDHSSNTIGVGVVARDERGGFVASFCTTVPFITNPALAEAVAAWKAIGFCYEQDFPRLILEGDALDIVQGLRQEGPSWCRYGQTFGRLPSMSKWVSALEFVPCS